MADPSARAASGDFSNVSSDDGSRRMLRETMDHRPTTRPSLACVAASLLLAGCAAAPASEPGAPLSTDPVPSATVAATTDSVASPAPAMPVIEDEASAAFEVPGGPDFPVVAFESLWLLAPDAEEPAVVRVDPSTGAVLATIPIGDRLCQGIGATTDAIWACTADGAVRIDPETDAVAMTVPFEGGQAIGRLATSASTAWFLGSSAIAPDTLVAVNAATNETAAVPLERTVANAAYGFGAVWITAPEDGVLLRVDEATGEITEHASGLDEPWSVTTGAGSVWVTLGSADAPPSPTEPTVARIDPDDGSVLAEIATGGTPGMNGGIWASDEAVWVRAPAPFLVGIDPSTNEVMESIGGPGSAGDVTVAGDAVWVTAAERNTVYHLAR